MSGYVKGRDRNQISVGFMCLDNLIDENNKVRAIDAIVEWFTSAYNLNTTLIINHKFSECSLYK